MVHWYERSAGTQPSFIAARCYCCCHRPAQIFVNGVLSWDRLHMMISRSTTPDLIKIVNKLEEFFIQQHKSGMRALAVMTPAAARRGKASMPAPAAANTECEYLPHHQTTLPPHHLPAAVGYDVVLLFYAELLFSCCFWSIIALGCLNRPFLAFVIDSSIHQVKAVGPCIPTPSCSW